VTGAFWPLLAMAELVALLAAVLLCVVLGIAGLAVQLRRHRAEPRATAAATSAPVTSAPLVEQDDDSDPFRSSHQP
jgi:hypothetical protein